MSINDTLDNLTTIRVLYAADAVAVCTLDAAGDLDLDAALDFTPAEARRLAADLLDAAVKAETAPPRARTLRVIGGRS